MPRDMQLSQRVIDAIHVDEVGLETGRHGECLVKTIYHPVFRRDGRDAATPWGVEGRTIIVRDGKTLSEDDFQLHVMSQDEVFITALRGVLPMRNYLNLGIDDLNIIVGHEAPVYCDLDTALACIDMVVQAVGDVWVEPSLVHYRIGSEVQQPLLSNLAEELSYRGIQAALSDFGTEQSSVSRLEMLKPPLVKLDSTMFARLADVPIAVRLMASIVERLQREGCQVQVGGIETPNHLRVAVDMGANLLEGSLLRAPKQAGLLFDTTPVNLAALLSESENVVSFISTMRSYRDTTQSR